MRQTKLGLSSYCFPYAVGVPGFEPRHRLDAFGLVDRTAELGVSVLQIADNCPLDALTLEELDQLNTHAKARGVALEVGTRGIRTAHLERYLNIAARLDSRLLRVVIDTADHRPQLMEIDRLLRAAVPLLERYAITLGIENHDRFSAEVFADLVRKADSPWVGIVLDTVNSFACEENTEQVLSALASYTVNFHMKDFKIERVPNSMGLRVTGTPAGQGFLRAPQVLARLAREARSDFTTVLELWMEPEPTVEETLMKESKWVEESVLYLKEQLGAEAFLPGSLSSGQAARKKNKN